MRILPGMFVALFSLSLMLLDPSSTCYGCEETETEEQVEEETMDESDEGEGEEEDGDDGGDGDDGDGNDLPTEPDQTDPDQEDDPPGESENPGPVREGYDEVTRFVEYDGNYKVVTTTHRIVPECYQDGDFWVQRSDEILIEEGFEWEDGQWKDRYVYENQSDSFSMLVPGKFLSSKENAHENYSASDGSSSWDLTTKETADLSEIHGNFNEERTYESTEESTNDGQTVTTTENATMTHYMKEVQPEDFPGLLKFLYQFSHTINGEVVDSDNESELIFPGEEPIDFGFTIGIGPFSIGDIAAEAPNCP